MQEEKKMENKIMQKIKSGHIKLRSKYVFFAEKLGLNGALALTIILAILFFNLFLFYLKTAGHLVYLSFGKDGILALLETFPYLLVIVFLLFLLLASYLSKKNENFYKKPFSHLILALIILVIFLGSFLTYLGMDKRIEKELYSSRPTGRVLKPFFNGCLGDCQKGIAGLVSEINQDYLIIKTPRGLQKVILKLKTPCLEKIEIGNFIIAAGEKGGMDFFAYRIKLIDQRRIPLIEQGIHQRFLFEKEKIPRPSEFPCEMNHSCPINSLENIPK